MLNSSDILRGYTDTIILAQLDQGDNYGYVISKNVQEITRGELELKEATLYTTPAGKQRHDRVLLGQ